MSKTRTTNTGDTYGPPPDLPDFDGASASQIPALLELVNLGYSYIPREEIAKLREGTSQYVLREIAFEALRKINGPSISDKSIRDAIFEAESSVDMGGGVFRASEEVFSLMLAGRSVSELVDGRRVSPQMKFIDFAEPDNNTFHVCAEFELSEGHETAEDVRQERQAAGRPDLAYPGLGQESDDGDVGEMPDR